MVIIQDSKVVFEDLFKGPTPIFHSYFGSRVIHTFVTRFGKIRINAATNYFFFFLLTGYTGPEDLDFQV